MPTKKKVATKKKTNVRSVNEIIKRIKETQEEIFGFQPEVLVNYLPHPEASKFLKDPPEAKHWNKVKFPLTREKALDEMSNYMIFALEKARDHRGLSASRSISKMQAWLWLLKDDEKINWDNYENYGVPILQQICALYKLPFPVDNEEMVNMSRGNKCTPDCESCGRG
jgi:hypothetical protein